MVGVEEDVLGSMIFLIGAKIDFGNVGVPPDTPILLSPYLNLAQGLVPPPAGSLLEDGDSGTQILNVHYPGKGGRNFGQLFFGEGGGGCLRGEGIFPSDCSLDKSVCFFISK